MRKKFSVVRERASSPTDDAARVAELELTVRELRRHQELAAAAEDQLRREMADVLHSRVQSRLLAATLRLRRVEHLLHEDPTAAARFLEEVRRELDTIREDDVREVSHLLHPAVVAVGLTPALRRLAKDLQGAAEVTVTVSAALAQADDLGGSRVPEEVRLALYRLVEEATTNALKHGDATAVDVRADVSPRGEVVVSVTDNGCGFDPATSTRGLGLLGVEGRLAAHHGRCEVRSAPGAGTTVTGAVPVIGLGLPDAAPAAGSQLSAGR
ncbi:MAG: sensor histidine kinase [Actinomycetes bacterium]